MLADAPLAVNVNGKKLMRNVISIVIMCLLLHVFERHYTFGQTSYAITKPALIVPQLDIDHRNSYK